MTSTRSANDAALPSASPSEDPLIDFDVDDSSAEHHEVAPEYAPSAHGFGAPTPRRSFLRRLASLPFVGGSFSFFGARTVVAEPVTLELVEAYKTWLSAELSSLTWQMADDVDFVEMYRNCYGPDADRVTRSDRIRRYQWFIGDSNNGHENPYSRAALVLRAVGCDWHDREGIFDLRRRA